MLLMLLFITTGLVFFGLLLLALWFVFTYMLWRLGWRVFAMRYSTDLDAPASHAAHSASFGHPFATYHSGVRVGFLPQGVHFAARLPLGVAHAPFLLPWERVREARLQPGALGERVRLVLFDEAGRVTLLLPRAAWPALQAQGMGLR